MNRRHAGVAAVAAVAAVAGVAAAGAQRGAAAQSLLVAGASAMQPLVQALALAFLRRRPALHIVVEQGGSLPAWIAARRRAIDVAAMTRPLADSEDGPGARQYLVARDSIGVVVHPTVPLAGLTRAQVRALFAGTVVNWRALGGPDLPVTVCVPPRAAPDRQALEQLLLDGAASTIDARECVTDAALLAAVATTPGAIAGLNGPARASAGGVAMLAIDGVHASDATVLSGRYPYTHSCYLLLHGAPHGAACAFVRFARSSAGQAIVARRGLVAVC